MNDKIYIEMNDSQRLLSHICDNLEYAHAELAIGIRGEINSEYTTEEVVEIQSAACKNLENAINCVIDLIGAYAINEETDQ